MLALAAAALCSQSFAQSNEQDVVYLKNGSVIHGQIVEAFPDSIIKIRNNYNDVLVYPMGDVQKMTKEANTSSAMSTIQSADGTGPYIPSRGYRGFVDANILVGDYENVGILTTHGFQFNSHIFAGAGVGYFWDNWDIDVLPIYAACRYDILACKVSPFVDLRAGGVVSPSYGDSGAFFSVTAGVRVRRFDFSLGFSELGLDEDCYDFYYDDYDDYSNISFNLRFGVSLGKCK